MLKGTNISVGYGTAKVVFPSLSFAADTGDLIALLGVNGVGKSTLLRTLAGLQPPLSGDLFVSNKSLRHLSAEEKAKLISLVLTEKIYIDSATVSDLLALGRAPHTGWMGRLSKADKEVIAEVSATLHLQNIEKSYFSQLSDGQKQKVLIARALCQETPTILLDEPTAFLDFRNKRELMELLHQISEQKGKTIILSTHDIEAALTYCNKFWIMTEEKKFITIVRNPDYRQQVERALRSNSAEFA